jgi:hypothetical protein
MKKPHWSTHPLGPPLFGLGMAAAFASLLGQRWQDGTWTPSPRDAIWAVVGLLLSIACIIPDYLWRRRQGDSYVRSVSARQAGARLSHSLWWAAFIVGDFYAASIAVNHPKPLFLKLSFLCGALLGLITWYPHFRAVWKRAWALYEQDLANPPPPSDIQGETATTGEPIVVVHSGDIFSPDHPLPPQEHDETAASGAAVQPALDSQGGLR